MINVRVPDHWTGPQALVVCSFLEEVARAIWDRHGGRMARALYDLDGPDSSAPATPPAPPSHLASTGDDDLEDASGFSDDDIPFGAASRHDQTETPMTSIPIERHWTAQEADIVHDFLYDLAEAIWLAHENNLIEIACAEIRAQAAPKSPSFLNRPSPQPASAVHADLPNVLSDYTAAATE
jgi:hypothetical protein